MKKTNLKIGVSSCLLGNEVRYDGKHKQMRYITDILSNYFILIPVCPEVEIGMTVPREPVWLIDNPKSPQMVSVKTNKNWTNVMLSFSKKKIKEPDYKDLSGFILKNKSPSCGMEKVEVSTSSNKIKKSGVGLFAGELMKKYPLLPVIEEKKLNYLHLRENFICEIFSYARIQKLFKNNFSKNKAIEFHFNHKYLMQAHSPKHYTLLKKLVIKINNMKPADFRNEYKRLFMEGLKYQTTIKKHSVVLKRIINLLKKQITTSEREYLLRIIDDYQNGITPVQIPITLLKYFVEKHDIQNLKNQLYLNPHPEETLLRYTV